MSHKKSGKNRLTLAFLAQTPYFANFANFGLLWMVVYTVIIKIL